MKLIFFAHPSFLNSQSMTRFASMLSIGMEKRGHKVETWNPKARFFSLQLPGFFRKWMGYIEQYIVFRFEVNNLMFFCLSFSDSVIERRSCLSSRRIMLRCVLLYWFFFIAFLCIWFDFRSVSLGIF